MPNYKYEIKTTAGQTQSGVLQAASMSVASEMLRAQQAYILSLIPMESAKAAGSSLKSFSIGGGPGLRDVANFTSQLAVMIRAGISIRAALEGIADQTENAKFKEILTNVRKDVESGKSFSEALQKYPKVFSPLYINMVKASELSGSFSDMLERISEYLMQQMETRQMVVGAMIYPAIIFFMAVGTTIFLLAFVVPQFVGIFKGKEDLLPLPTKILLFLSGGMRQYWYILIGGAFASVWGFFATIKTEWGAIWWDKFKLVVPLFKKMFRALYISRSLHTMGELVNAGVPMLDTLSITADISGNRLYKRMWQNVYSSVKQGKKICHPLQKSPLLPKAVVQMISAGEESGKLGETLDSVAKYYNKELRATIKAVTSMIEPLMIVAMGGVVGFIAMSIILPIFKMSSLVK